MRRTLRGTRRHIARKPPSLKPRPAAAEVTTVWTDGCARSHRSACLEWLRQRAGMGAGAG
jgi:hypothetical protein